MPSGPKAEKQDKRQIAQMDVVYSILLVPDERANKFKVRTVRTPSLLKASLTAGIPGITTEQMDMIQGKLTEIQSDVDGLDGENKESHAKALRGIIDLCSCILSMID